MNYKIERAFHSLRSKHKMAFLIVPSWLPHSLIFYFIVKSNSKDTEEGLYCSKTKTIYRSTSMLEFHRPRGGVYMPAQRCWLNEGEPLPRKVQRLPAKLISWPTNLWGKYLQQQGKDLSYPQEDILMEHGNHRVVRITLQLKLLTSPIIKFEKHRTTVVTYNMNAVLWYSSWVQIVLYQEVHGFIQDQCRGYCFKHLNSHLHIVASRQMCFHVTTNRFFVPSKKYVY